MYTEKDAPCQINIIINMIPQSQFSHLNHRRASSCWAILKIKPDLLKGNRINIRRVNHRRRLGVSLHAIRRGSLHNNRHSRVGNLHTIRNKHHNRVDTHRDRQSHRCHHLFHVPTIIVIRDIHNRGRLQDRAHQDVNGEAEDA